MTDDPHVIIGNLAGPCPYPRCHAIIGVTAVSRGGEPDQLRMLAQLAQHTLDHLREDHPKPPPLWHRRRVRRDMRAMVGIIGTLAARDLDTIPEVPEPERP